MEFLVTNDNVVTILSFQDRKQADRYCGQHGLTILKTDKQEMARLLELGARVKTQSGFSF